MDLQAIRYAAMVADMTLEQAVDAHRDYTQKREKDVEEAASSVSAHLTDDAASVEINSSNPRIILVSANFSKEPNHQCTVAQSGRHEHYLHKVAAVENGGRSIPGK